MATIWRNPLTWMAGFLGGKESFEEKDITPDPFDPEAWDCWERRLLRYRINWSFYMGRPYSSVYPHALQLRTAFGMYAWSRACFNPAGRIGEFWGLHTMGGRLDPDAGDGKAIPSALPIVCDNQGLRGAIAQVWRDSNWQEGMTVFGRDGAVMGDVAMKAVDDEAREKVYLQVVRPTAVKHVDLDPLGNCKGYVLEERRPDPEWDYRTPGGAAQATAIYTEVCEKDGDGVYFWTYRDGEPYDWTVYPDGRHPARRTAWDRPYGFVPLAWVRHTPSGFRSGWSEYQLALAKMIEADDLGSIISDQARRKMMNPVAINMQQPSDATDRKARPTPTEQEARDRTYIPGRDSQAVKWFNNRDLRVHPLAGDLSLADADSHHDRVVAAMEREFPELLIDNQTGGELSRTSGRAILSARQKAEAKVHLRRCAYDAALARVQMMAVSIGAMGGYPGFEAFDAGSFDRGDLAHSIGDRPVFQMNHLDKIEEATAESQALLNYVNARVDLGTALKRLGWPQDQIDAAVKAARAEEERQLALKIEADAAAAQAHAQAQLPLLMARTAGRDNGGNPPASASNPIFPATNTDNQPKGLGGPG